MRFPEKFIFGTATSAFQIEGGSQTEWKGFRGEDGTLIGSAIDHYTKFKEDLDYILYLGNAYRFSMDWSRLQKGPYFELDSEAVNHYRIIFETLKKNNKKVFLVLHHFANPLWMFDTGCWAARESPAYFFDYVKKVLDVFGDYIDILNTFNEPNAYVNLAYLLRTFLPKRFNPILRKIVFSNMARAHMLVYEHVKENYPKIITGISQAHMTAYPMDSCGIYNNIKGNIIKKFFDSIQHEPLHKSFIKNGKYADYIGFSYYGRIPLEKYPLLAYQERGRKRLDELGIPHDDMWELYPEGIYKQIKFFYEKYKKSVLICENGTCTDDDDLRKLNLYNHLKYVKKALDDGLPVIGYFHWSTFDNFELAYGPSRKFGLTSIDFKSPQLERKIKGSGHYYHDIISSNTLIKL